MAFTLSHHTIFAVFETSNQFEMILFDYRFLFQSKDAPTFYDLL
jgi:hypothetical protein